MFAYYCQSPDRADNNSVDIADRLSRSLGLFWGGPAAFRIDGAAIYASCGVQKRTAALRSERRSRSEPSLALAKSKSGDTCIFCGDIDNRDELAARLGLCGVGNDALYLAAYERWGNEADNHCIGDYCALIALGQTSQVRLSRSPWRGPPLHYYHDDQLTVVSSVPRVFKAVGLDLPIDRQKLADNLYCNLSEDRGWFEGTRYVDIGTTVLLDPGGGRRVDRFYDHLQPRKTEIASRSDCVRTVDRLLREACQVTMAGSRQPGIFLSGGLDSSNVAVRAVEYLPEGRRLKSFTFRPHRESSEAAGSNLFHDEWPYVATLAERYEQIEPFECRSEAYDDDWSAIFLAAGQAPISLPNMGGYSAASRMASAQGCDLVLAGDYGNIGFSASAPWAISGLLRRGRLRELHKLCGWFEPDGKPRVTRTLLRVLARYLPDAVWAAWERIKGRRRPAQNDAIGALNDTAKRDYDVEKRARESGTFYRRARFTTRKAAMRWFLARGDMHVGDIVHAYEQIYGFRWRDVTSYRPLIEYCLGLPDEMFVHDGIPRWLGRQLGKGLIPEEQLMNRAIGSQIYDWHEKLTPHIPAIAEEVRMAKSDPVLSELLDFEVLERSVEEWPASGSTDDDDLMRFGMALPRAVMIARYVRFVTGRN